MTHISVVAWHPDWLHLATGFPSLCHYRYPAWAHAEDNCLADLRKREGVQFCFILMVLRLQ